MNGAPPPPDITSMKTMKISSGRSALLSDIRGGMKLRKVPKSKQKRPLSPKSQASKKGSGSKSTGGFVPSGNPMLDELRKKKKKGGGGVTKRKVPSRKKKPDAPKRPPSKKRPPPPKSRRPSLKTPRNRPLPNKPAKKAPPPPKKKDSLQGDKPKLPPKSHPGGSKPKLPRKGNRNPVPPKQAPPPPTGPTSSTSKPPPSTKKNALAKYSFKSSLPSVPAFKNVSKKYKTNRRGNIN